MINNNKKIEATELKDDIDVDESNDVTYDAMLETLLSLKQ